MTRARSLPDFAQSFDTPLLSGIGLIILTNHKKGCFAVSFTVSTCSVSQKYRLSLREVLREMVLRETKKGL